MKRKTVEINRIKIRLNNLLAVHTGSEEFGSGIVAAMEELLRETDSYLGFRYLEQHEVPDNCKPGIFWKDNLQGSKEADFHNTDRTRVLFY